MPDMSADEIRRLISRASRDPVQKKARLDFLEYASDAFQDVGQMLHVFGHILGVDRKSGLSPFGHGDDEKVGIALLLQIASQIISASTQLLQDGRAYVGSALIRQLVEVEYLAWAFETRDAEAARWLRSDKRERQDFFAPRILRAAADGKFRAKDYSYHCEMGGHPTPFAASLLRNDHEINQLMLGDMVSHARNIWVHLGTWAVGSDVGSIFHKHNDKLFELWSVWGGLDELRDLPPPP
jgi:hypothetical protein